MTVPGLADAEKGMWEYAPFSGIKNVPIADILKKKLNMDIFIENDVNACAVGEKLYGCCQNDDDFLWITISNGIGGALYINGLQGKGVACSLKHFAANNQDKYRLETSVDIDERTLREIYLKGFEIALEKSKPESIMCAYNKINAVPCSENLFILNEILRDE